jgi:hypothetical protein
LLAYVSVNESFQLNYELVERGYARNDQEACRECARYSTAATEARDANRRVWGFNSSDDEPDGSNGTDIELVEIRADAPGDDDANTDEEYILFQNNETSTVDFSGWTLADDGAHEFTLPDGVEVGPGERLEVNTGSGNVTDAEHVV